MLAACNKNMGSPAPPLPVTVCTCLHMLCDHHSVKPTPLTALPSSTFTLIMASVPCCPAHRSDVEGDPNAWMRMTRGLQAVKSASTHKGVWLVLVVVQDGPVTELPQDRIAGLWNSFEPK